MIFWVPTASSHLVASRRVVNGPGWVVAIAAFFCVFYGLAPSCQPASAQGPGADQATMMSVAANSYSANREAFSQFTCKFTITTGKAKSVADAMNGVYYDTVVTTGLWACDGPVVKYELRGDESLLKSAKVEPVPGGGRSRAIYPYDAEGYLTDGQLKLQHSPNIGGANIYSADEAAPGIKVTPFGVGLMGPNDMLNPARNLRDCVAGKVPGSYDGTVTVDGVPLQVFTRGGGTTSYWFKYMLNPAIGFQPHQLWGRQGPDQPLDYKCYFTRYIERKGRWFPGRSVTISYPDRKEGPYHIKEVAVSELNTERPPSRAELSLTLPSGTQVSDRSAPPGFFNVNEPLVVDSSSLQAVLDRARARSSPDAINEGRSYRTLILVNIAVALVALMVYGAYYYSRRTRSSA